MDQQVDWSNGKASIWTSSLSQSQLGSVKSAYLRLREEATGKHLPPCLVRRPAPSRKLE